MVIINELLRVLNFELPTPAEREDNLFIMHWGGMIPHWTSKIVLAGFPILPGYSIEHRKFSLWTIHI